MFKTTQVDEEIEEASKKLRDKKIKENLKKLKKDKYEKEPNDISD